MGKKIALPDHHIQVKIYDRLVHAVELRYSELKPDDIEANSFMYHLKELIKLGLVEKADKKYRLSSNGQALASRFSVREKRMRLMPTTISVICLRASDGEYMFYERKRQPYIGTREFPSGKIHHGQTLEEAAYREMLEKTGYEDIDLRLAGSFSIKAAPPGDMPYSVVGFVWKGRVEDKFEHSDIGGHTFWEDPARIDLDKCIPGTKEIYEAVLKKEIFMLDINI